MLDEIRNEIPMRLKEEISYLVRWELATREWYGIPTARSRRPRRDPREYTRPTTTMPNALICVIEKSFAGLRGQDIEKRGAWALFPLRVKISIFTTSSHETTGTLTEWVSSMMTTAQGRSFSSSGGIEKLCNYHVLENSKSRSSDNTSFWLN